MKPDPWYPGQFLAFLLTLSIPAIALCPLTFYFLMTMDSTMPTTESPGRIYMTESGGSLVQEITKIHTDGNGEVIKTEVFLEYVGVLPPEKQIRLRSHDKVELVKDLSVPGAKLRK